MMRFYWGHKKQGIMNENGFHSSRTGRVTILADSLSTFRFYGLMVRKLFFGIIVKDCRP